MKRYLLMAAMLVMAAPAAPAAEFVVKPGGENKVSFVSKATIESFEGKTSKLSGRMVLDPAAMGDTLTIHFEVDMASLDTGIGKRNQRMREDHLETDRYPIAAFDGAALLGPAGARLEAGKPASFDVEGTFSLHGVKRRLRIKVDAAYDPKAGRISFKTAFPVALADYAISRPEFLFLKLADTQDVHVSGVAVAAAPAPTSSAARPSTSTPTP